MGLTTGTVSKFNEQHPHANVESLTGKGGVEVRNAPSNRWRWTNRLGKDFKGGEDKGGPYREDSFKPKREGTKRLEAFNGV